MPNKCSINRDQDNNIISVLSEQGNISETFNRIREIAPLNQEQALSAYLHARDNDINIDNFQPSIEFRNPDTGESFTSYRDALNNSNVIDLYINDINSATIKPTFDNRVPEGFVNTYIKQGILSENKSIRQGKDYFVPEGRTILKQGVNKQILLEDLQTTISPSYNVLLTDNGIQFQKQGRINHTGSDKIVSNKINDLISDQFNIDVSPNQDSINRTSIEQEYKDTLQELGISSTSTDQFIQNYKLNNADSSAASVLSQITNNINDFIKGNIETDQITQETANLIVQALPKERLNSLIQEAQTTQEWAQDSEAIYNTLNNRYSGETLNKEVGTFVLGKALHNALQNTESLSSIQQKLYNQFRGFITKSTLKLNSNINTKIDNLNRKLNSLDIKEGNTVELGNRSNIANNSRKILFSKKKLSSEDKALEKTYDSFGELLSSTTDALNALIRGNSAFHATRSRVRAIQKNFYDNMYGAVETSAIKELVEVADSMTSHLENVLTEKTREEFENRVAELQEKKGELSPQQQNRLAELNNKKVLDKVEVEEFNNLRELNRTGNLTTEEVEELAKKTKILRDASDKTYDSFQNNAYQILTGQILPLLTQMRSGIDKQKGNDMAKPLSQAIDKLNKRIEDLERYHTENIDSTIDSMIDDIANRFNLDDSYKDYARLWMNHAYEDTSYLHKMFGLISNSQDPMLAMASFYGQKIFNDTDYEFTDRARHYQTRLRELVKEKDLVQLFDKGWLVDQFDQAKMYEFQANEYVKDYIEVLEGTPRNQISEAKIKEVREQYDKRQLPVLSPENSDKLRAKNRETRANYQESYFTPEYHNKLNQKYEILNISETTRRRQNSYTSDRLVFMGDAMIVRGDKSYRDYSQLTLAGEERVKALARERNMHKQVYNSEGNLKNGISFDPSLTESDAQKLLQEGKIHQYAVLDGTVYYLDASKDIANHEDAIIALDLQRLDQQYFQELQQTNKETGNQLTKAFMDELNSQPDEASRKRFIELNSNIGFSQEFWNTLDPDNSIVNLSRQRLSDNPETQELLSRYSQLSNKKKAILSQFKHFSRPFEIRAENMLEVSKQEVENLDNEISDVRRSLSTILRESLDSNNPSDVELLDKLNNRTSQGATELNEAFMNELEDSGSTLDDFVRINLSADINSKFTMFKATLDRAKQGYWEDQILPSHQRVIEDALESQGLDANNPSQLDIQNLEGFIKEFYLARLVPSYYSRFVPKELVDAHNRLENLNSHQLIELANTSPYFQIRPNYSYGEGGASSENLNPNYNPNAEGLFQPKAETARQLRSEKFQNLFGNVTNGKAQRNQNLYDALQIMKEMNKEVHENTGRDNGSALEVPQIYQRGVDRIWQTIKKPNLQTFEDNIKQFAKYREDDLEYGTKIGSVNTIPVFYARRLQNQDKVSTELFTTFMMNLQQSILHKNRRKNAGKFGALLSQAALRDKGIGRENDSTVAYKMLKNYMNYAVYGQRESIEFKVPFLGREYDMTKLARFLLTTFRMKNLALTPIVPLTSLATESLQYGIDKRVGEIVDKDAGKLANKEFMRIAGKSVSDVGKLYSDGELNILMESLGVRNTADRYKNANYGYIGRFMNQLPMGLHQAATFPVSERIALSVLYDYRVVNGKILNYREYKLDQRLNNRKLTEKQIRRQWKTFEDKTFRDFLETKPNTNAKVKDSIKEFLNDPNGQTKEEYIQDQLERVIGNVRLATQRMDTILSEGDRIEAQRNFAMSFLTTHKQWLSLVTENRFKKTQRNLMSGNIERGSYRTLYDYFGQVYKELFGKGKDLTQAEQSRLETLSNKEQLTTEENIELQNLERRNRQRGLKAFQEAWYGKYLPEFDNSIGLTRLLKMENPEAYVRLRTELQDLQRRNLHRVMVDAAWMLGAITIAAALYSIADDEEYNDNYAIQLANYIAMRTVNQQLGNQTGVPLQWWESAKDPIVGLQNMGSLLTLPYQLATTSGEYEQGFYKGRNRRAVLLEKTLPGMKVYTDMSRLNDKSDQYYFFNNNALRFSGMGALYTRYVESVKDNSK